MVIKKDLHYVNLKFSKMVQVTGVEPARIAPLDPKSSASASSAIPA